MRSLEEGKIVALAGRGLVLPTRTMADGHVAFSDAAVSATSTLRHHMLVACLVAWSRFGAIFDGVAIASLRASAFGMWLQRAAQLFPQTMSVWTMVCRAAGPFVL